MAEYINKNFYKQIAPQDRHYINLPSANINAVMEKLNAENIVFSATISNYKNVVTVRKSDSARAAEAINSILSQNNSRKVIGNTEYKYISDKRYINTDPDIAMKIAAILSGDNTSRFSGIITGDKATITVSGDENAAAVRRMAENLKHIDLIEELNNADFERVSINNGFVNFRNKKTGAVEGFDGMDMVRELFEDMENEFFHPAAYRIDLTSDAYNDAYYISRYDLTTGNEKSPYTNSQGDMVTFVTVDEAVAYVTNNNISITNPDDEIEDWRNADREREDNSISIANRRLVELFSMQNDNYPDRFVYNEADNSFVWTYFNPDGDNGNGEFVEKYISEQDIYAAYKASELAVYDEQKRNAFVSYLFANCREAIIDTYSGYFESYAEDYISKPANVTEFYGIAENSKAPDNVSAFINYLGDKCPSVIRDKRKEKANDVLDLNSDNIEIEGYTGTWYVIEAENIKGKELFWLESEYYGEEEACLIVDENRNLVMDDVHNGFADYIEANYVPENQMIVFDEAAQEMWQYGFEVYINGEKLSPFIDGENERNRQIFAAIENADNIVSAVKEDVSKYHNAESIATTVFEISENYNKAPEAGEPYYLYLDEHYEEYEWQDWKKEYNSYQNTMYSLMHGLAQNVEEYMLNTASDTHVVAERERALANIKLVSMFKKEEQKKISEEIHVVEELNYSEQLYEKVNAEYNNFISNIKKESAEVLIQSAAEIVDKDRIRLYLEEYEVNLTDEQYKALLSREYPLDEIYEQWSKNGELHSIEDVGIAIEEAADRIMIAIEREKTAKSVERDDIKQQFVFMVEQNGETAYYRNDEMTVERLKRECVLSDRPFLYAMNNGSRISGVTYAEISQSENGLAVEVNVDEKTLRIYNNYYAEEMTFDEVCNEISAADISNALDLENNNLTFSVVSIDGGEDYVVGGFADINRVAETDEYIEYIKNNDVDSVPVRVDFFSLGNSRLESEDMSDEQVEYVRRNLDDVMSIATALDVQRYDIEPEYEKIEEEISPIDRAIEYINDYVSKEFDLDEPIVSIGNLKHVSLGYTELGDDANYPFQVEADLEDYAVNYYINDMLVRSDKYDTLEEFIESELTSLEFDYFVSEGNDLLGKVLAEEAKKDSMTKAKEYISKYVGDVYGEDEHFRNMKNISIDHFSVGRMDEHIFNMEADLDTFSIRYKIDGNTIEIDTFNSLAEMNEKALSQLNYTANRATADRLLEEFERNQTAEQEKTEKPLSYDAPYTRKGFTSNISPDMEMIDHILRCGSDEPHSLERIVAQFQKNKSAENNAEFLKKEFGTGGKGYVYHSESELRLSAWFDESGITVAVGETAFPEGRKGHIDWTEAARRIADMLGKGNYCSQDIIDNARENDIKNIAEKLWYMHQDSNVNYFILDHFFTGGFEHSVGLIAEALHGEKQLAEITEGMRNFVAMYEENPDVLRFKFHKPKDLLVRVEDLSFPHINFKANPDFSIAPEHFITEDSKDYLFMGGSGVSGGKFRIAEFFDQEHTLKEKADFLKNEFGVGGVGASSYDSSYDSKGISYSKGPNRDSRAETHMNWNEAAKRVDRLVSSGKYITQKDINNRIKDAQYTLKNARDSYDEYAVLKAMDILDGYGIEYKMPEFMKKLRKNTYEIYQIPAGSEHRDIRFLDYEKLGLMGLTPKKANYESVYGGNLDDIPYTDKLEGIYTMFNIEHPEDYTGRSLSVSDVVVIDDENGRKAYYVDSVGFKNVSDMFLTRSEQVAAEETPQIMSGYIEKYGFEIDFNKIENAEIEREESIYIGGIDNDGHERKDNYSRVGVTTSFEFTDDFYETIYTDGVQGSISQVNLSEILDEIQNALDNRDAVYINHKDGTREKLNARELLETRQREQAFMNTDIAAIMAKSVLAWDEIEDIGYRIFEDGYIDKFSPSENALYGNGLSDKELYNLAKRMQNGENIRKELATALIGNQTRFVSEDDNEFTAEYSENDITVRFGNAEKKIGYDELGDAFISLAKGEYDDIVRERMAKEPETAQTAEEPVKKISAAEITIGDRFMYNDREYTVTSLMGVYPDDVGVSYEEKSGSISYQITSNIDRHKLVNEGMYLGNSEKQNTQSPVGTENGEYIYEPKINDLIEYQDRVFRIADIQNGTITLETADTFLTETTTATTDELLSDESFSVVEERGTAVKKPAISEKAADKADEPKTNSSNFVITDEHFGEPGGAKSRYADNITAIKTLKAIESENRTATVKEQQILAKYTGWGAIPQVFDSSNDKWTKEYAELSELLTDDEYMAARKSTMNAHYTSPIVINAIYEGLNNIGFNGGKILEPAMGIGNFFGKLPEIMRNSDLHGVELDDITGRIAKQLYPDADVQIKGFEQTSFADNSFDVAIGNVPFGDYKLNDRKYSDNNFLIHDYFFAKALDKVHPGGVIAFVTSKGTMDKENSEVRKYLAQRAELLGAIRLPNNAFKANAGTEVTSDIIFLQKRERPIEINPDEVEWLNKSETSDGFRVNSYFVKRPEMVLGTIAEGKQIYGPTENTQVLPIPGADLKQQLKEAVHNIKGRYKTAEKILIPKNYEEIPAPADSRKYSLYAVDGNLYYREGGDMMKKVNATKDTVERATGMIEMRDNVRKLLNLQLNNSDGTLTEEINAARTRLNDSYNSFVAKYGNVSDKKNAKAMQGDDGYNIVAALELKDEKGQIIGKSDIFSHDTVKPKLIATHVDTAEEALILSVSEKAKVDFEYMTQLCGMDKEKLVSELQGQIYRLPTVDEMYVTADEYLTGNIRKKLRELESAPEDMDVFGNRKALESAMPLRVEAKDISVKLGAHWVDTEYIADFIKEKFNPDYDSRQDMNVQYCSATGSWKIEGVKPKSKKNYYATNTYGTHRKNAYEIIEAILNNSDITVKDRCRMSMEMISVMPTETISLLSMMRKPRQQGVWLTLLSQNFRTGFSRIRNEGRRLFRNTMRYITLFGTESMTVRILISVV